MSNHLGFRELILDQSILTQWRSITIDTGAAQSTLQDIKVPEYGGCYMYEEQSGSTRNRYIFWRVCHDMVELWEESLDQDIKNCNIQLRFADTPVLEGLSIHETPQHVVILVATVSSVHRIRLRHPMAHGGGESSNESVFGELTYHNLRDFHYHHVLSTGSAGESLPHTAGTYLVQNGNSPGSALFVLGLSNGSIVQVTMANLHNAVHTHTITAASMINRFFTGFVPNRFRSSDGGEASTSLSLAELSGVPYAFGICADGRLRAWDLQKMEMILVHNCLENTAEVGRRMTPGAQRHLIRICRSPLNGNSSTSALLVCVYLNFSEKQMIVVLQPVKVLGQLEMKIVKSLYPPQHDLVDICITSSYIWTLWTDQNNESKLLYSPLTMNGTLNGFKPGFNEAFLEPFPERTIPLSDPAIDPMECYMKELMANNRFSAYTLQKALGIYRHNSELQRSSMVKESTFVSSDSDTSLSGLWNLAEAVELALKEEIESRIITDMNEDEIADIKLNAWATFYSHTLQYHQVGHKAVSLVDVGGGGIISIIRKQSTTWIRPLDALELLMLSSQTTPSISSLVPIVSEESSVASAMIAIAKALRLIKENLDPEVKAAFCTDLHHLESPDQVASSISTSLLAGGECLELEEPLSQVIEQHLSSVSGIMGGLEAYLKALGLDKGNPDALSLVDSSNDETNAINGAFSSSFGSSILSSCVYQLAHQRLELCRDLLILQHIMLILNTLQSSDSNRVLSTLLPQTTILTQAYFALMEVSSFPATIPTPAGMDASKRQMATLALSKNNIPVMKPNVPLPATSLGMFVRFGGGAQARLLLANFDSGAFNANHNWAQLLLPLTTTVSQLSWPISRCLSLLEFLVWGGQQATAQAYVRLLQRWCEWNSCSRKFLLAVSLLGEGESRKAKRLLLEASEGLSTEEYLGLRICGRTTLADSLEALTVQYCLKCIRLLEQAGYIEHALDLATNGLSLASSSDSQGLAALYSVAFKHHLELWHHDEAFTAFLACPDEGRRRNCLRQMIITLYDRKCLSTLIGYTYGSLEPEVVKILENRARSADILVNNYYDLLFAFHVSKFNYKKAAWVMYECALRLNVEGLGENALQQQAKCYLACLNCLRHIQKDQAWIIKPLPKANDSLHASPEKETNDDGSSFISLRALKASKKRPQIQLMEIADIEREYELVHARIKIYKEQSASSRLPVGPMNSSDTISLLSHLHIFKDACRLSTLFDLSLEPVMKILASACVQTDRTPISSNSDWVERNRNRERSSSQYWKLLKEFLEKYESGKQSHLHRAATSVILFEGHSVPAWLHDSYKKRNCGQLISMYLGEGMLEDATRLTVELLDGLLGHGTKQIGLPNALHACEPAVWFPYTTVDHLMLELQESKGSQNVDKLYNGLSSKMKRYQDEVLRISQDRLLALH